MRVREEISNPDGAWRETFMQYDFRQVTVQRRVELPFALFVEYGRGQTGKRLGGRSDVELRCCCKRLFSLDVRIAETAGKQHLRVPHHDDAQAGCRVQSE